MQRKTGFTLKLAVMISVVYSDWTYSRVADMEIIYTVKDLLSQRTLVRSADYMKLRFCLK